MNTKLCLRVIVVCAFILFFVNVCKAQLDSTKFFVWHSKDVMTDKEYYFASKGIVCVADDNKKGFKVTASVKFKNGKLIYSGLTAKSAGLGACVEGGELIFLFEDNTKHTTKAWNDFNCENDSYFDLYGKDFDKLVKRLKAIRFTNGKTYESYTKELDEEDKNYFLEVKAALDNSIIAEYKGD